MHNVDPVPDGQAIRPTPPPAGAAQVILDDLPAALTVTGLKQLKPPPMPREEQRKALGFSDTV